MNKLSSTLLSILFAIGFAIFSLFAVNRVQAQIPMNDSETLFLIGDLRFGYFSQMGEQRDGSDLDVHEMRLRSRTGLRFNIHENVYLRARYGIRMTSRDIDLDPGLHTSAAGNGGLKMGEGAFDEAYINVSASDRFSFRIGRFQTNYSIPGVISNSIQRHDSPNTDVRWTDGVMLTLKPAQLWSTDFILQYHYHNPPTNAFRSPIQITTDDSPISLYTSITRSIENRAIENVSLDINYTPDALIENSAGDRADYLAASLKSILTWDIGTGRELQWGGEIAYSFNRPENEMVGFINTNGDKAGGFGFQSNVSVRNLFENHHLGIIAATLEPSLLTSSDYWNNILLLEIRHQYVFNSRLSAETRIRYRGDLQQLDTADQKRWQIFPYARLSYRFK